MAERLYTGLCVLGWEPQRVERKWQAGKREQTETAESEDQEETENKPKQEEDELVMLIWKCAVQVRDRGVFIRNSLFIFYFTLYYLFMAALGLRCCVQASHCSGFSLLWRTGSRRMGFSSCGSGKSWDSLFKFTLAMGFPGGAVVKNPPANARDTGSSPGPRRPHMPRSNSAHEPQLLSLHSRAHEPRLLGPCATATEACVPRARAPQQEKPLQWDAHAPQCRVAPACRN